MTAAHVFIVEDDEAIGSNLERALTTSGYRCSRARTAAEASTMAVMPNLVLLDLGLPDGDGVDVTRHLVDRWPGLPIIILTARVEELDIVVGLDAGAVDYMTKPFRLAELLARVRAQLRHVANDTTRAPLVDGPLHVDRDARRVLLDGTEIELRAKEFDLLVELVANAGTVITREDLMSRVWDEHWFGSTKTLDVHIAALRRRLGEAPGQPSQITALRAVGYRWEPSSPLVEDR